VTNVIILDDERRKRGIAPPLVDALSITLAASLFAVGLGLVGFFTAMMIAGSR